MTSLRFAQHDMGEIMAKLFAQLIEKHKEKEYEKPKYPIRKLYVGAIVKLTKREHVGFGTWYDYFNRCKDFAIFYKVNDNEYVHIKSGQKLSVMDRAIVGDYCLKKPFSFAEQYAVQMREDGYTKNTKLSKKYIDELETAQNMEWAHGPIPMHNLFGA